MDRPTHEIETPVQKHKVVMHDWVTGGDKRSFVLEENDVQRVLLMVKACVVSIDGKADDLMGSLDMMHGKDSDFVMFEVGHIVLDSSLTPEKKS